MKSVVSICIGLLFSIQLIAQAPQKMSYQAVVRDVSNNLVSNQSIGMRISILQGSIAGSSVYVETQASTTNANGLASIEIGTGSVQSGVFASINWANGPYFIKTETDPTGGTNYTITGTSELLSVPYALLAVKAVQPTFSVVVNDTSITNLAKTIRNYWFTDPNINLTVPESGTYLLSFYGNMTNNNEPFNYEVNYDLDGYVRVYNSTTFTELINKRAIRKYVDWYSTNSDGFKKYLPLSPSQTTIVSLAANDILQLQYNQNAVGNPSGNFYIGNGGITIVKVNE